MNLPNEAPHASSLHDPNEPVSSAFTTTPDLHASIARSVDTSSDHEIQTVELSSKLADKLASHSAVSLAGEQYRLIRTRIVHHHLQPRTVLVSSPGVGDGKSTTAINLAYVLALRDSVRTLLIDGDLRHPSIGKLLGIPERPGLAEVLRGTPLNGALVRCAQNPALHILTAGVQRTHVTELLDTGVFRDLIARARKAFDFVIVDSPPINSVADYELLQNAVDGLVVVIRPEHTDRALMASAFAQTPRDMLIGVVLNAARKWQFWKNPQSYYDYSRP